VQGDVICSYNKLETLEGAPRQINGVFDCSNNQLKTLKGAPQQLNGSFDCSSNQLETLEGGPVKVGNFYDCSNNKLITLKGLPREIRGDLWCYDNLLTSFGGCARSIDGNLYASSNKLLTSLEGGPSFVAGEVHLNDCPKLTSLQNIHNHFPEVHGWFYFNNTNVKEHMLGLLLVRELQGITLDDAKLEDILRKYINNGGNLLACALELIEAGYEEQAKL
jgi:hypothetical protein